MNNYKITVKHDAGKFTVSTTARDEAAARQMVCASYNCPDSAISKVIETPCLYKVYKVGRKSTRRQILRKGLTEQEAQCMVHSYPNSSRSMVCYTRQ